MSKILGITTSFHCYLQYLNSPDVNQRIATLQLTGKIEDYLTKEYISFLARVSDGTRFVIMNSGLKGEPKIDMSIIREGNEGHVAESLIEVKYFRNRHRLSPKDMGAVDEHNSSFKELARQISFEPKTSHGFNDVLLRARTTKVFGLVFVSYTRCAGTNDRKAEYFSNFLSNASKYEFRFHDLHKPYIRSVYEDTSIKLLGKEWLVTLRAGLWRRGKNN